MKEAEVVELVEQLAAIDLSGASVDSCKQVLQGLSRVVAWSETRKLAVAQRLAALALESPAIFPEQVVDKARRKARAEADRKRRNEARVAATEAKAAKRPRHTKPDYEKLLCLAEQRGWVVFRDEGYFKCRCPCAEKHINTVVLTPSSRRTLENTRARFRSFPCWKEEP